jgi:ribosomal protein S18 acetylase RimI-like enzyme
VTVALRRATADDLPQVTGVFLACWRGSYAAVLPERLVTTMTDERAATMWARALTAPTGATVVAAEDGNLLGVTRYDASGTEGAVHSLYISPAAQGLGIGSRLLDHAVADFAARGVASATLWVFAGNGPAIAFYRSRGWLPDGGTRVEPEFGEAELRLRRELREGAGRAGG